MKYVSTVAVSICLAFMACGGSSTGPTPTPSPSLQPTPSPTASATPGPAETACSPPLPPPLAGWRVGIQNDQGYKKVLDSRALVGPDTAYCASLGLPGSICVVREETHPEAVTCQNRAVGVAKDTHRYGPTWYWVPKGSFDAPKLCRPLGDTTQDPGCKNHPTNQYFLNIYGPGKFILCGENGVCGEEVID